MSRIKAIFFVIVVIISTNLVNGATKVPCYFIFGDSLSDAGNNNALNTKAKANYSPYGIDFPGGVPTGRFSNGRTTPDFIRLNNENGLDGECLIELIGPCRNKVQVCGSVRMSQLHTSLHFHLTPIVIIKAQYLGFKEFIKPYSPQMGQDALRGVNYASGAAGILPETGSNLGQRIWLNEQLLKFNDTISKLQPMLKEPVAKYLNKCLFTVNIGSNDYINNYYLPKTFNSSKVYTKDEYATLLISRYRSQLQALYNHGARKVAIFGLGQIGCIPAEKARFNSTRCVKEINTAVQLFNKRLVPVVNDFNSKLRGAKFTFINLNAMQSSTKFPFGYLLDSSCCKLRSDYMCEAGSRPCRNRLFHGFMDGFHPTEIINQAVATVAYNDPLVFVHPSSISQLL